MKAAGALMAYPRELRHNMVGDLVSDFQFNILAAAKLSAIGQSM
jgi:hypothetical protein